MLHMVHINISITVVLYKYYYYWHRHWLCIRKLVAYLVFKEHAVIHLPARPASLTHKFPRRRTNNIPDASLWTHRFSFLYYLNDLMTFLLHKIKKLQNISH